MKIFLAKRLRVTLLSLLMVGSVLISACYDDAIPPALPTPSYVAVPTPPTCERKIRDEDILEDSLTLKDSLSWSSEECHIYFHATADEIVTITMSSLDLGFDPALKLYDPYDSLLTENDDSFGLDSSISEQVLPWQGWYKIVAKSYNHESFGRFELTITKTQYATTLVTPQQAECGRMIDYEESVLDTIVGPDEACYFLFWAYGNDRITISMRSIDEDFYPALELYTPLDSLVAENDNFFSFNGQLSEQILPSDGWYTIVAKPYNHEGSGRFKLTLTKTE